MDEILWCDHLNEISSEVLSCDVICFKKFYKMKFRIFVEFAFDHIRELIPTFAASIMAKFEQFLRGRFGNILERSFKGHKNSH